MTSNALDLKGGVKDSGAINKRLQLLRRDAAGSFKGTFGGLQYLTPRHLIYDHPPLVQKQEADTLSASGKYSDGTLTRKPFSLRK